MKTNKFLLKALIVTSLVMTGNVLAATADGPLVTGAAATTTGSQGSFDINVTKQDAVQISNLNAINITYGGVAAAPLTGSDAVCYYATTADYSITMDSQNATAFNVTDGTNNMPYTLTWTETTGNTQTVSFAAANDNVASAAMTSDNTTSANCGSGTNATIGVAVTAAAFNAVPPGLYTDTVNITIKGI